MCGTFRMDAGALMAQWDTGDGERLSFARSGEGFTLDGDPNQPARGLERAEAVGIGSTQAAYQSAMPLGDDRRVAGRYRFNTDRH